MRMGRDAAVVGSGKRSGTGRPRSRAAPVPQVHQRALTYIVISKPKRRSQAVGVVHCIGESPDVNDVERHAGRSACAGTPRFGIPQRMVSRRALAGQWKRHDSGLMIFMNRPAGRPSVRRARGAQMATIPA
jgi:hypothetical protein